MRNIIVLSLLALTTLLASCTKESFTISGTVSGKAESKDSTVVYLYADPKGEVAIDSTLLKDGKFEIKGSQDKVGMGYVGMLVGERFPMMLPVVLEAGNIVVSVADKISITGTTLNDKMNAENNKIEAKFSELSKIYQDGISSVESEEDQKALEEKLGEAQNRIIDELVTFIKENLDNPIGVHFFQNSAQLLSMDKQKEIIAVMPDAAKADKSIAELIQAIEAFQPTEVGDKFADIKGLSIDGKEVALSDYAGKGKVVLVDFWASWCAPCIGELPNVKNTYARFKDKGFEIVGVSLDEDKDAWKSMTEEHELSWPQFSNLKGWDEPAARVYNVRSIPHTVLIDKDGTIIEKNLRGEAIDKKLEELLK